MFEKNRDNEEGYSLTNVFSYYGGTLHVPYGCVETYKNAYVWEKFKNIVKISTTGPKLSIEGICYQIANEQAYVTQGDELYADDISIPSQILYEGNPYPVKNISSGAFQGYANLWSMTLPEGLTTISSSAFSQCTNLLKVTIPSSVTTIGNHTFDHCPNLKEVYNYSAKPQDINYYTFTNRANTRLYVPAGSLELYRAATYWKQFYEIIEMEVSTTGLNEDDTVGHGNEEWFSIDGMRLSSPPVRKGIYIHGGKKVVVIR